MRMSLKSLARNESSIVGNKTIIRDIEEYENGQELLSRRDTVSDYLDVLDRLHLIENQEAYGENYRSPSRVGKCPAVIKDSETGIYIVPITALKP